MDSARRGLEVRGLTTFIDRLDLPPGQPWPKFLEEKLKAATAVAVFLGPHGLGNWQRREMWLALDRQAQAEGRGETFAVIPVFLPEAREIGSTFLGLNTWVDLRHGLDDERALDILAAAANGQPPRSVGTGGSPAAFPRVCPYRSLSAFREEDAAFFFGREVESAELLKRARAQPLVAVVGASGSGKSSLVRAGLLPLLRREKPPRKSWDVALFTPGSRPFHRLAAALLPLLEPDLRETDLLAESEKLGRSLAAGEVFLGAVVDRLLEKSGGTDRLLLVVDQFEELFTQSPHEEQQGFAQLLHLATEQSRLTVVITVRGEFFASLLSLPLPFASAADRGQFNLLAMSREGLLDVIEKPAGKVGLRFEPGLAAVIRDDVGEEPGQLPLLEFALTEVWERSQPEPRLTLQAYVEGGKVAGAIAQRAEQLSASLSEEERGSLRRLMTRLVRVSERPEAGQDSRQRLRLAELSAEEVALARRLADERLVVTSRDLTTGEEIAEVAHEALVREWAELRQWLDEDRAFLLYRQDLQRDVDRWLEHGRSEGYVLAGDRLGEAERWRKEHEEDLTEEQRAFLEAGADRRGKERLKERREKVRLRRLSAGLGVATLLVTIAAGLALAFKGQVDLRNRVLSAQLLTRRSQEVLAQKPQLATLLAREALQQLRGHGGQPLADAEAALRAGLTKLGGTPLVHPAIAYDRRVLGTVLGENGRWLATETRDRKVRLSRISEEGEIREVLEPLDTDRRLQVEFGGSGGVLSAGAPGRTRAAWDLSLDRPKKLFESLATDSPLLMGAEGRRIVQVAGASLHLWTPESGEAPQPRVLPPPAGPQPFYQRVVVSPGEQWLVASSAFKIWTWKLSNSSSHPAGTSVPSNVLDLAVSGDDELALLEKAGVLVLGQLPLGNTGLRRAAFQSPGGYPYDWAVLWAAERSYFARDQFGSLHQLGRNPQDRVWRTIALNYAQYLPDPRGERVVATHSGSSTPQLFDLTSSEPLAHRELPGHEEPLSHLSFSSSGRWLLTSSDSGVPRIWEAARPDKWGKEPAKISLEESSQTKFLDQHRLYFTSAAEKQVEATSGLQQTKMEPTANWLVELGSHSPSATEVRCPGSGWVTAASISAQGNRLYAGLREDELCLCNLAATEAGSSCKSVGVDFQGSLLDWRISDDGAWLATQEQRPGLEGRRQVLFRSRSGLARLENQELLWGFVHLSALPALSSKYLAAPLDDFGVLMWDLKVPLSSTKPLVLRPTNLPNAFRTRSAPVFSPDERWLFAQDGQLWDLGRLPDELTAVARLPLDSAKGMFSGDSRSLVGVVANRVCVFDLTSAATSQSKICGPVASRPGVLAVSTGAENILFKGVGEVLTLSHFAKTTGAFSMTTLPEKEVLSASFSPDGRYLATAGKNGVLLWDLNLDSLLDKACKATGRNLTCAEWKEAFGDGPYRRTCPELPGPWDAAEPESAEPCSKLFAPLDAG